ncbi:adenylate/guanylate cyclase domain-containing protein [Azospirillum sp. ST 5-10]|uniref:adenylate/guanylate cyclase domain-containing protein n=1 Tax=unclassified Azospirillum TaxID=2630922 RepID=UPI003F49EC19
MKHTLDRPAPAPVIPVRRGRGASSSRCAPVVEVVEWLAGDDCHAMDEAALAAGLGRRLRAVGLPVDRLTLHLRTLHPEILGRTLAWAPDEAVEVREHGLAAAARFVGSAVHRVMETGKPLRVRMADQTAPVSGLDVFAGRGLVELLIAPLNGTDGPVSAAAFGTARPGGFSAADHAALQRILPALRNGCELRTLRQMERTLLDTYVGTATARRILAGHVRRGQVETLRTALLLCDMRGFTDLSNRLPSARVLALLDRYFDEVLPAVAAAGGEVLKFMGDAVLAFFPDRRPEAACAMALRAAREIGERLAPHAAAEPPLAAAVALHYGEVSYGNIGSGRRLDFTLVGPDVNLVSRIQAVGSRTGRPLLMSRSFADRLPGERVAPVGRFALKGFAEPVSLFGLAVPPDGVPARPEEGRADGGR